SMTPAPNPGGYVSSKTLTVAFSGAHTDADTGSIGFECQFYNTAAAPADWNTCTSPATYTGLSDTTTTPYTFRVRAVDTTDRAVQACDANPFIDGCLGDPDLPDHEPGTSRTIAVDTVAPNTFLNREPVDKIRPDWPVVLTTSPTLEVNSNEPAGFSCAVNGDPVTPCGRGTVTLRNLAAGDTTFVARAVDRGGNLDPTPVTTRFFVPADLKPSKGSGWKNVRKTGQGLFDNDYVEARKVGQTLVVKRVKKVREVRLIAPVGPRSGTIQVRVGRSQWYTVDLRSKTARTAQILVRDAFSPLQSGTIQIRVVSLRGTKSSVRLDALVARS
ncbi:hypothetical protein, partial [Nocardioides sp.]|uniref:hypothetical protein n=1 Tax=Nocardioides sp. TaxID=35761 RepID=UPI0025F5C071